MPDDLIGRFWEMAVNDAGEAISDGEKAKAETKAFKDEERLVGDCESVLSVLRENPDGLTKTRIKTLASLNDKLRDAAIFRLLDLRKIESAQVAVSNQKTKRPGFRIPLSKNAQTAQ